MKKFRRIAAVLMAAMMISAAATGCSNGSTSSGAGSSDGGSSSGSSAAEGSSESQGGEESGEEYTVYFYAWTNEDVYKRQLRTTEGSASLIRMTVFRHKIRAKICDCH